MFVGRFAIGQTEMASPRVESAPQGGWSRQDQDPSWFQESSRFTEGSIWNCQMLEQRRHRHGVERSRWQRSLSSDIAQQELGLDCPTRKPRLEFGKALRAAIEQSDRVNEARKVIQQLAVTTPSIENFAAKMFRDPGKPCVGEEPGEKRHVGVLISLPSSRN